MKEFDYEIKHIYAEKIMKPTCCQEVSRYYQYCATQISKNKHLFKNKIKTPNQQIIMKISTLHEELGYPGYRTFFNTLSKYVAETLSKSKEKYLRKAEGTIKRKYSQKITVIQIWLQKSQMSMKHYAST